MAIKVTKQGKVPTQITYRGTCTYCQTAVECEQRDVDAHSPYGAIPCPTCQSSIIVFAKWQHRAGRNATTTGSLGVSPQQYDEGSQERR